jgi:hypothetical protein
VDISVSIVQGVASFEMTQRYASLESQPVENLFYFPRDIESTISKLTCEFTLRDSSKKLLETRIEERSKAEVKYEDAVAIGKAAVIGRIGKVCQDMVSIGIGQFPPMA